MFSRFTSVIFHVLPLLAAAAATGSCPDSHTFKCCNSAADASEGLVQGLLNSLGLEGITGLVGSSVKQWAVAISSLPQDAPGEAFAARATAAILFKLPLDAFPLVSTFDTVQYSITSGQ
ncbi:hypothetical protein J132_06771 [Termitomyces sp. J132]|nr:hypothetical protein J132_06771 [Termitomyces sp. J132]